MTSLMTHTTQLHTRPDHTRPHLSLLANSLTTRGMMSAWYSSFGSLRERVGSHSDNRPTRVPDTSTHVPPANIENGREDNHAAGSGAKLEGIHQARKNLR
jgi:hypothetical protein